MKVNDDGLDLSEDNLIKIILVALHAYEVENNEVFSVDKEVLSAVYANAIENGKIPVMYLHHNDDEKTLEIRVDMEVVEDE